jgi:putative ABC transport system substrate-binding protein
MRRREFIVYIGGALACPIGTRAQQPTKIARVAWVSMSKADPQTPFWVGFRNGMRSLGWVEGTTVVLESWWADGSAERLRQLIPQIVSSQPDVIVANSGPLVRPMIEAEIAQPIVFAYSADPVIGKVVESRSRPGVNRTGVSYFSLELVPKRLELLKELFPRMNRVAIVGWPPHAGELLELDAAKTAVERLGLAHQYYGVTTAEEVDAALDACEKWRADAIVVFAGAVASTYADRIAAFSARSRIPAVSAWADFAEKGNLMTYGPAIKEAQVRLAWFVDRILKGAKAAEIAVELPTKIELVINLKTAKALGLTIPPSLLSRADEVIE